MKEIIKIQNKDMLWKVDEWETEWLDNGWTPEQLLDFVKDIVQSFTNAQDVTAAATNPEQTVSDMAKSAMKRRQS